MEKTANTIKVPTVRRFFSALQETGNVIDDLAEDCIITPNIIESYDICCANVIESFLDNKHIALSVVEECNGEPLAYDIYVFDEAEPCRAYIEATVKSGRTCKAITIDELKETAPYDWQNPFNYRSLNDFVVLHTEID